MSRSCAVAAAAGLLLLSGCGDLLVKPARQPGGLAVSISGPALQAVQAGGAGTAFGQANRIRIFLVPEEEFDEAGFDPVEVAIFDTTLPFNPADSVRVALELDDALITQETDLYLLIALQRGSDPLFAGITPVTVRPGATARAFILALAALPSGLVLEADRDTLAGPGDSTFVRAMGLFATGDTVPAAMFFPDFSTGDPGVVAVADQGTVAKVTAIAPGTATIVSKTNSVLRGFVSDSVDVVVCDDGVVIGGAPVAPQDACNQFFEGRQGRGSRGRAEATASGGR